MCVERDSVLSTGWKAWDAFAKGKGAGLVRKGKQGFGNAKNAMQSKVPDRGRGAQVRRARDDEPTQRPLLK